MNTNTFTTSLACVAALLLSSWNGNYGVVDASLEFNAVVTCLADAPTICAGTSSGQGPSPAIIGNTTTYVGGSKFTYEFMEGLEMYNGTEFYAINTTNPDNYSEAIATTFEVSVSIADDGSCVIDVGTEDATCASCSTELPCNGDHNATDDLPLSVTFDCTNVLNGRASLPEVCEAVSLEVEDLFYPLLYTTTGDMNKAETDTNVDGLTVDSNSTSTSSSSSSNGDAAASTTTTSTTSTCGLLPAGTLPQKDADCLAALPEGTSTIWCEDLSYAGAGDTQTDTSCTCDRSNPSWKCTATDTALAPNQPCPPRDQPEATGNSCKGQLSQPNSSMTCMWSRSSQPPVSSTSDAIAMVVSSISCECKRGADGSAEKGNEVWVCEEPIATTVSKENNDNTDTVDSMADVGTMAAATTGTSSSSTRSTAVPNFAVMAVVGVVGAVFTVTTL